MGKEETPSPSPEGVVRSDSTSNDIPGEKSASLTGQDVEVGNSHLVDLEVDFDHIFAKGEEEGDYAADTSPFPAVRAVVPETDDKDIPVNTLRAWLLGIVRFSQLVLTRAHC